MRGHKSEISLGEIITAHFSIQTGNCVRRRQRGGTTMEMVGWDQSRSVKV